MNTLMGVGYFVAAILLFSLVLTLGEFFDRLQGLDNGSKNVVKKPSILKHWPISIWLITWIGIKNECRYGRLGFPPETKERRII